jgi:phosphatidate phosphatase PAH1
MQLEAEKEKSNTAKFRLDDEREMREAAQENLKEAQEKMREQEEARIRSEEQRDVHEAESQEWQKKYTGLKRKLKGLAEDDDEPAETVAKY